MIDLVARRYHLAPWTIDPEDPAVYEGIRRTWVFMDLEGQRDEQIAKRRAKGRGKMTHG